MEIEKILVVAAPAAKVWEMLLDPNVMGGCVPGMKSIEVINDVEYVACMHVKISFVSAKFKLKTKIVEQRAPHYLRAEGTGEDKSVASSLKQQSEIFLSELEDGQATELRIKVKVDVLGRLGTFGLSVMKTKADRMWEEFGVNLAARLSPTPMEAPAVSKDTIEAEAAFSASMDASNDRLVTPGTPPPVPASMRRNWWSRLLGTDGGSPRHIHVELQNGAIRMSVDWPVEAAAECRAWLNDCVPAGASMDGKRQRADG